MEKSLEAKTKWLRDSGLKVNQSKMEVCLFYKHDVAPVRIRIGETTVLSKKTIGVLGLIFDSKLQWADHIMNVINKV